MRGVLVVSQEVAPTMPDGNVNQAAECSRGVLQPFGGVVSVEIQDRAGVGLLGPGQEAFIVALDPADGAVDDLHLVPAKVLAHLRQEVAQAFAGGVDLRNDLSGPMRRLDPEIQRPVIIVEISAELMRVRPVNLARGG